MTALKRFGQRRRYFIVLECHASRTPGMPSSAAELVCQYVQKRQRLPRDTAAPRTSL